MERKLKLWVDLTGLNQTSFLRTNEIGWNIKKTRLILRETLIRCDFTLKLYKAIFNVQWRKKKWQTQCDFFFVHSHITKSSSATNLNVNLEPGVLNQLIGEPPSTTQEHSPIPDIYSILLWNSKNALQREFLTIAFISVFSEFESKMLEVSKVEEDTTHSYAQGSACYTPFGLLGFVNYTYLH